MAHSPVMPHDNMTHLPSFLKSCFWQSVELSASTQILRFAFVGRNLFGWMFSEPISGLDTRAGQYSLDSACRVVSIKIAADILGAISMVWEVFMWFCQSRMYKTFLPAVILSRETERNDKS